MPQFAAPIRATPASAPVIGLRLLAMVALMGTACLASPSQAFDQKLADQARATVERAGKYFASTLSVDGAYVWAYSEDLSVRKGEGKTGPTSGWIQPPGTPAVGAAFLRLRETTGDASWLAAAKTSGKVLVDSQLLSGGWYYSTDTSELDRANWCYRVSGITPEACGEIKDNKARNRSVLDDDNTQAAMRFLIWLDRAGSGGDPSVRETIDYGFKRLSAMQYPNGSWPVFFDRRNPKDLPADLKATLPTEWPRTPVKPQGGPYYILNDNTLRDMVHLYLVASDQYKDGKFMKVAGRAGEFLLAAQLPPPQQGWAQTYDGKMQPVWGRKFEPPSVASRETAGAITCLVELYHRTGDERFLQAARNAGEWLRLVRLPDGDWARFYELATNRPLYIDNDEKLTYETSNLLDHYSLKAQADIPQALAYLDAAETDKSRRPFWPSAADSLSEQQLESRVRELVQTADAEGRWIEDGWIKSQTFVDAVFIISRYLDQPSQTVE
jgi:hypothetical protein